MTDISTDRVGNLKFWPDFLPDRTHEERSVWRFLLCVLAGVPALILALLVGGIVSPAIGMALLALGGEPVGYAESFEVLSATMQGQGEGLAGDILLIVALGVMFTIAGGVLLGLLKLFYPRPVLSWVTAAPAFRWRLFTLGVVAHGVVCGILFLVTAVVEPDALYPPIFEPETLRLRGVYVLTVLAFLPLAAAFEELLCRGWMMQQTAAWTRNLIVILFVNAVIFSALHADPDMGRNVARLAMGLAFSWAAIRLGGMEFSIGAHTINNVVIALFAMRLSDATDVHQASELVDVITDLGTSVALVASTEIVARIQPFRRWAQLGGQRAL